MHYAAANGAALKILTLLLEANRDAPSIDDNVRSRYAHAPIYTTRCHPTHRDCIDDHVQDKKRPLHHAVMSGAPFDVTKLLLDANREAAAAADEARSSAGHCAPPITLCGRTAPFGPSFLPLSSRKTKYKPRIQEAKLPLHHAAAKGAPFDVMELLFEANPDATISKGKARPEPTRAMLAQVGATVCSSACVSRGFCPPVCVSTTRACTEHVPRVAQNGKLPLHYAVEKGATLEVVKLLLGSQGNATTATAADKARRCANTALLAACHISTPQLPPVLHPWPC